MRHSILGLVVLMFFAGASLADEIKATVKKVDVEKRLLTISINDETEQTLLVSRDAEIYRQGPGRPNRPAPKQPLAGGLAGVAVGNEVTLRTFKSGSKEIVTALKVEPPAKRKKKDK